MLNQYPPFVDEANLVRHHSEPHMEVISDVGVAYNVHLLTAAIVEASNAGYSLPEGWKPPSDRKSNTTVEGELFNFDGTVYARLAITKSLSAGGPASFNLTTYHDQLDDSVIVENVSAVTQPQNTDEPMKLGVSYARGRRDGRTRAIIIDSCDPVVGEAPKTGQDLVDYLRQFRNAQSPNRAVSFQEKPHKGFLRRIIGA